MSNHSEKTASPSIEASSLNNKHFNTTSPVVPAEHYCVDPMTRLDWEDVQALIAAKKFFVLHAPRQTGKTSTLLAMMDVLNQSGE